MVVPAAGMFGSGLLQRDGARGTLGSPTTYATAERGEPGEQAGEQAPDQEIAS
jgi:hypothetical protein